MGKDKNDYLVVQSNSLIEAQYKLGIIPAKLLRKLVSMIKPTDESFEKLFYRLSVADFAELTGSDKAD